MKKKLLSLLLVLVMVLSMVPAVYAVDSSAELTVTAAQAGAHVGDEVEFSVTATAESVTSLEFTLSIPTGMTYVAGSASVPSGLKSDLGVANLDWTEGSKLFTMANDTAVDIPAGTVLLTFKCKLATAGTYSVSLDDAYGSDSSYTNFDATVNAAGVKSVITVHVSLDASAAPYAWAWGGYGNAFSVAWPGVTMTADGDWWVIDVPTGTTGFIVSNGSAQAPTATIDGTRDVWLLVEDDLSKVDISYDGGNTIEGPVAIVVDSLAIVGSGIPGVGSWNPADAAGDMEKVSDGVYEKTLEFTGATSMNFKFAGNDAWVDTLNFGSATVTIDGGAVNLGCGGSTTDIKLTVSEACTLKFTVDLTAYQAGTGDATLKIETVQAATPEYTLTGATVEEGDTFTVAVGIANNPGIISLRFKIVYDMTALELVSVENKALLNGWTTPAPTIKSPYTLRWADSLALSNSSANGTVAVLTFKALKVTDTTVQIEHVEARRFDSTKITFTGVTADVTINVKPVPATGVTLNKPSLSLTAGDTDTLTATVTPSNTTDTVVWSSSDKKVATVDQTGMVTAVSKGNAVITATAGSVSASCNVAVACRHSYVYDASAEYFASGADCENAATYYKSCELCGEASTETFTNGNSLGHDWTEKIQDAAHQKDTAANCTEVDTYWFDCSRCDKISTAEFYNGEAGAHAYTEKVEDAAHLVPGSGANCQNVKQYYLDCAYCDSIGTEIWNSTTYGAHKVSSAWTTVDGEHYHECTVDGCDYIEDKDDCSGGNATCTAAAICSTCNKAYGTTASHDYKAEWNQGDANGHWHDCADCDAHDTPVAHTPGAAATEYTDQVCTDCGYVITPALGHNHATTEVTGYGAKCTETGRETYYICRCGKWFADAAATEEIVNHDDVIIPVLGHDMSEATCDAPATCKRGCGHTEGGKLEHSFTNYVSNGDATCTADGTKTAECGHGCGETDTVADVGSASGHSYTNYVSNGDATCTADGTKTAACDHGCGETDTVADAGSATGHSYTDYVSNGDATCTADGTKTAECDHGCGETDTVADEGSKLAHSFVNYVSNGDATCTADGTKTGTCQCGETDTAQDEGTMLGHIDEDGDELCDRCGADLSEPIPGTADNGVLLLVLALGLLASFGLVYILLDTKKKF